MQDRTIIYCTNGLNIISKIYFRHMRQFEIMVYCHWLIDYISHIASARESWTSEHQDNQHCLLSAINPDGFSCSEKVSKHLGLIKTYFAYSYPQTRLCFMGGLWNKSPSSFLMAFSLDCIDQTMLISKSNSLERIIDVCLYRCTCKKGCHGEEL